MLYHYCKLKPRFNLNVTNINDGEVVAGVFLNLSKAFESVEHNILLQIPDRMRLRGQYKNCCGSI